MAVRNTIIQALEEKLWNIKAASGYTNTLLEVQRNPRDTGKAFPSVYIFEGPDTVFEVPQVGQPGMAIIKKRKFEVVLGLWLTPSEEGQATNELMTLYDDVRKALFQGSGAGTLDGTCRMDEAGTGEVRKLLGGGDIQLTGIEMKLILIYKDNPQETY